MAENQTSNTENVKLGPCKITYDKVDLGYTKGGVEVTVETSTYSVTVDQFGEAPIDEYITGRTVTVSAPLAETTKQNLQRIMPGANIIKEGAAKAKGKITVNTNPSDSETLTVNGVVYTFKTSALLENDIEIGESENATATAIQAKLSVSEDPKVAIATYEVDESTDTQINVEYKNDGVDGNKFTLATNSSGISVDATLSGGLDGQERVEVSNAVGVSLLKNAKELKLHPIANADDNYEDDFTIPAAGVAGAMNYSYMMDQERIFPTEFKAYPVKDGDKTILFYVGAPKDIDTTNL